MSAAGESYGEQTGYSICASLIDKFHSCERNTRSPMSVFEEQVPAETTANAIKIDFEKYQLANGLEVILSEDHRLPSVAVNLWYHVGPANERPGRTGFAHLFEHMMFQGSKHVGAQPIKVLETAGATQINGTTGFDRTNYFETVPAEKLEFALWFESDRMAFLPESLTARNLANQRDVVRNERRQGENAPYKLVHEELFRQLFPEGHPYHASIIGSHADIEAVRLEDVREFCRQYYVPNNASLALVGDFDSAEAKRLIEKYFGLIPAGQPVPKVDVNDCTHSLGPEGDCHRQGRVTSGEQSLVDRSYLSS